MFDDQIRRGLEELADGAPLGGNLEAIRSEGLRKRRNRAVGQLAAAAVFVVVSGLAVSQLLGQTPSFVNTDVVEQPVEPEPESEGDQAPPAEDDASLTPDNTAPENDETAGDQPDANSAAASESGDTSTPDGDPADPVATGDTETNTDTETETIASCRVDAVGTVAWSGGNDTSLVLRSTDQGTTFLKIASTRSGAFTDPDYQSTNRYQVGTTTTAPTACTNDPDLVCLISGPGRLTWADTGHDRYLIRKSTDGTRATWLTTVLGETIYSDPSFETGDVYVIDFDGQARVPCQPTPSLLCQVNSLGTVSWNRAGGVYRIYRAAAEGAFTEVDRVADTSVFADEDYQLGDRYQIGSDILENPYPCRPDTAFVCVVTAPGQLRWTDHGQARYRVFRSTDRGETFTWLGPADNTTTFSDTDHQSDHIYAVNYEGMNDRFTCY